MSRQPIKEHLEYLDPILKIFQSEPNKEWKIDEIYEALKTTTPGLCDDSVLCTHRQYGGGPEWHHQTRWALLDLKNSGEIEWLRRGVYRLAETRHIVKPTAPSEQPLEIRPPEEERDMHAELQQIIFDLASYFKMMAEKEFREARLEYDVIWRKIERGNPANVFEIHHKGGLEAALTKLKHAYDMWLSNLFLVVTQKEDIKRAEFLLSAAFNEIMERTMVISGETIREMYEFKKKFHDLETSLRR